MKALQDNLSMSVPVFQPDNLTAKQSPLYFPKLQLLNSDGYILRLDCLCTNKIFPKQ